MQVIYKIDHNYDPRVLEAMLEKARMAGVSNVVVFIPTYKDITYVQAVNGLTMQGKSQFSFTALSGDIVTLRTISTYRKPMTMVIAAGIEEKDILVLEDRADVAAVVIINDNLANVEGWLKMYDAIDATTGQSIMTGMVIAPLLNRTIGWLKEISANSTPLYNFKRKDYLCEAANLLKRNNIPFAPDAVATKCIKRGLDSKSARAVAAVFAQSLQVRGDLPIKVGKPDYAVLLATINDAKYDHN